jgi:hypothetical protein
MPPLTLIQQFVRDQFGRGARFESAPLRGGLEAGGISRVTVRRRGQAIGSFVAKPFSGAGARALHMYRMLAATEEYDIAPRLLGWRLGRGGEGCLFIEWVEPDRRWPWQNSAASAMVMSQLAELHCGWRPVDCGGTPLYDAELAESAHATLDVYRGAFLAGVRPGGRSLIATVERLVGNLPRLRRELAAYEGMVLLHGDAHPGNVVMRKGRPVLLDWGRARIGSPLEDVSSWIHSVAFWEPEARRRHDTLLRSYRAARGHDPAVLPKSFREACILGGACNALAGALRYHLAVMQDERRTLRQRVASERAAADWLRILRRAGEVFAT